MSSQIDYYTEWLNIPPGPRPPDHYTLLGLDPTTATEATVRAAAQERTQKVRALASSAPDEAREVLHALNAAKDCLVDVERRAKYDRERAGETEEPVNSSPRRRYKPTIYYPESAPFEDPTAEPVPPPPRNRYTAMAISSAIVIGLLGVAIAFFVIDYRSKTAGRVEIETVPAGAMLTVNGNPLGRAPQRLHLKQSIEVTAEMTGYQSVSRTLSPKAGHPPTIVLELQALPAVYSVRVDPVDARVSVDAPNASIVGKEGEYTVSIPLPDGIRTHTLTVSLARYVDATEKLTPQPGEAKALRFRLVEEVIHWYEKGMKHLEKGEKEQALTDLTKAVKSDPTHIATRLARAQLLFDQGDLSAALQDCSAALKVQKDNAPALAIHGAVRWSKREIDGARNDAELALRKDDKCALAWAVMAGTLLDSGREREAITASTRAIDLGETTGLASLVRGLARQCLGLHTAALRDFETVLKRQPKHLRARLGQIRSISQESDARQALRDCDTLLASHPDHPAILAVRAAVHRELKDLLRAILDGEAVLKQEPDNLQALETLALAYAARGKADSDKTLLHAQKWATLATSASAKARARTLLAEAWLGRGDLDKAEANATEAIGFDQQAIREEVGVVRPEAEQARPYMVLAEMYLARKERDKAVSAAREASKRNPASGVALAILTRSLLEQEKYAEALEPASRWLRLTESAEARGVELTVRTLDLLQKSKTAEALAACKTWIKGDPSDPRGHAVLGMAQLKSRNNREAILECQTALTLNARAVGNHQQLPQPLLVRNHLTLAIALANTGDVARGVEQLQKAMEFGKNKAVLQTLARLHHVRRQYRDAVAVLEQALAISKDPESCRLLAWIVSTCPDAKQITGRFADAGVVLDLAKSAVETMAEPTIEFEEALAACYAHKGIFQSAIVHQQRAVSKRLTLQTMLEGEIKQLRNAKGGTPRLEEAEALLIKVKKDRQRGQDWLKLYQSKEPLRISDPQWE